VAFDATVLCGALLNPAGLEFELLLRAAQGLPFRGFTPTPRDPHRHRRLMKLSTAAKALGLDRP